MGRRRWFATLTDTRRASRKAIAPQRLPVAGCRRRPRRARRSRGAGRPGTRPAPPSPPKKRALSKYGSFGTGALSQNAPQKILFLFRTRRSLRGSSSPSRARAHVRTHTHSRTHAHAASARARSCFLPSLLLLHPPPSRARTSRLDQQSSSSSSSASPLGAMRTLQRFPCCPVVVVVCSVISCGGALGGARSSKL